MSVPGASTSLPVAISMGDPAGIGLELIMRAWSARRTRALPAFYAYADPAALAARAQLIGAGMPLATIEKPADAGNVFADALPVMPIALRVRAEAGMPNSANAGAIIASIEAAVEAAVSGQASAIVTCPISKATLTKAGFPFPGHTEFLGALADRLAPGHHHRPVMMLASDTLKVVPLTVHIPLAKVPEALNRSQLFATVRTLWDSLVRDFGVSSPRIAIAGLNPHAGESGTMGREEVDLIAPAIAELRQEGLSVTGPHPADTLFHERARTRYDAVIAMYHDQALIAIKTIAFDQAVNVTLGLPFVRTSPDHGTAFDIAREGAANAESFIQALLMAARMSRARTLHRAMAS